MAATGKKLHHKVARFYLKAWDSQGRDNEHYKIALLENRSEVPFITTD
jgi:hypothetical protein